MKTILIKCPCGNIVNVVYQPDTWSKDKASKGIAMCMQCKKKIRYVIVGGKCHSSYV